MSLSHKLSTLTIHIFCSSLVPIVLLSAGSESDSTAEEERFGAKQYLDEVTVIVQDAASDEAVAKVLRYVPCFEPQRLLSFASAFHWLTQCWLYTPLYPNSHHICDIFGYVFSLQSDAYNTDVQDSCDEAVKLLQRCISDGHIQREGARQSHLVLRRILKLYSLGISVVGVGEVDLTPKAFIEGMKCVSKSIMKKATPCNKSFLSPAGSSLTEIFILSKYWLSASATLRRRESAWRTFSLLCDVLQEHIQEGAIQPNELSFCFHSFIYIMLDPQNKPICPSILESLKDVLSVLFSDLASEPKKSLVEGVVNTLQKLCLALLQIHETTFHSFSKKCNAALTSLEFDQKASHGLLSIIGDAGNPFRELDSPWVSTSIRDANLKSIVQAKADLEESLSSDILVEAYDCLDTIANSGSLLLEDILGAEDILHQHESAGKGRVFGDVNEKFEIDSLFVSIKQKKSSGEQVDVSAECTHFMRIMDQYPVPSDEQGFSSAQASSMVSVDARARLLALRRLEKVLLSRKDTRVDIPRGVFNSLLSICMSRDPEEAKLVSSRCLGEMKATGFVSGDADQNNDKDSSDETAMEGDEPLLRVKGKALSMVAELLLSSCAETSFVAMKTAKALLATSDGKACFGELDDYTKGILAPFITNDNSQRKEELSMSRAYLDRLKAIGGLSQSNDNNTWCWSDGLWTCIDDSDSSADTWIKNTVCSMISCNFGRKSNCNGEDFFRLCQALCAKEAAFSATIFPAIIIHLLDSEARDTHDGRDISIRDKILSNTAVGSPASQMNQLISRCFSRLLGSKSSGGGVQMAPQAVTVVLNTLELLRFITER